MHEVTRQELVNEHPITLLIAAYWASKKDSALEAVCASAVCLAIKANRQDGPLLPKQEH